jgi:hypothetical protein
VGLSEAKKYLTELHRRQNDLDLWPDFLTGLPGKTATIRKVNGAYPQMDRNAIVYTRVANIQPYLLKYGYHQHTLIIQWAAAILKTAMEKYKGFVGAFDTHDFIAIIRKKDASSFVSEATTLFERKMKSFYSDEDKKNKTVLSFEGNGGHIDMGLMTLLSVMTDDPTPVSAEKLIPDLRRRCNRLEKELTSKVQA